MKKYNWDSIFLLLWCKGVSSFMKKIDLIVTSRPSSVRFTFQGLAKSVICDHCTTMVFDPQIFLLSKIIMHLAYLVLLYREKNFAYYKIFKLYWLFCMWSPVTFKKKKSKTQFLKEKQIFPKDYLLIKNLFCKKRLLLGKKNLSLQTFFFHLHIHRSINICVRKTLQLNDADIWCYLVATL